MVRKLLVVAALVATLVRTDTASQKPPLRRPPTTPRRRNPTRPASTCAKARIPTGSTIAESCRLRPCKNTFLVRWTLADDVEVTGVGILQNGLLAVSYFGGTPAVVVYRDRRGEACRRVDDGRDRGARLCGDAHPRAGRKSPAVRSHRVGVLRRRSEPIPGGLVRVA